MKIFIFEFAKFLKRLRVCVCVAEALCLVFIIAKTSTNSVLHASNFAEN